MDGTFEIRKNYVHKGYKNGGFRVYLKLHCPHNHSCLLMLSIMQTAK